MLTTNPHKIAHKLKEKGWKKHHISRIVSILKKHHPGHLDINWFVLLIILIGNIILLTGLLPVLIEMPDAIILITISIVGFCFGFLIDSVLREMDNLSARHYLFSGILIAIMATITIFAVIEIGNRSISELGLIININPLLTIFFYILSFSLPHLFYKTRDLKWKH